MPDELLGDAAATLAYIRTTAHAGAVQMEGLRNAALLGLQRSDLHAWVPDMLAQLEMAVQCHIRYLGLLHSTVLTPVDDEERY